MSEPGEIQFACIGCGTMNPAAAEVCAGCQHRFAGPDIVSAPRRIEPAERPLPRLRPRPDPFRNPYQPPSAPIAPPTTFRIGTGLVIIAVIAVCLAILRENVGLGVFAILMLMPASIRTPLVAARRRLEGRPMDLGEQVGSFLMTALASWAVFLSSIFAFCITCLPSSLVTSSIGVGLTFGAIGAVACAIWVTKSFLRMNRERIAREHEIRYW